MRKPTIALAQIRYFERDRHNLDKIIKYIRMAKRRKADIVCFPESCIHKDEILDFDDDLIKEIRNECAQNQIYCIINDLIIINKKKYNSAMLINRSGKILGAYKKMHLYGEGEDVQAGRDVRIFKTDFAKIGIAVCWDLAFPEVFRDMKAQGAQIIFCPSQWKYELHAHGAKEYKQKYREREKNLLKSLIMTRAFENLFYVALINPVLDDKDQIIYSSIAAPHKILSEIEDREGLITAKINLEGIEKLHRIYDPERIM